MAITFQLREYTSSIFGKIRRPVAQVFFQHQVDRSWQPITMLVDTGADYTLLPKFLAPSLGISLIHDCNLITTQGVGGKSKVYLLSSKITVRLGEYKRKIPVGFLDDNYIPPLFGRQDFLETFRVIFDKLSVTFE